MDTKGKPHFEPKDCPNAVADFIMRGVKKENKKILDEITNLREDNSYWIKRSENTRTLTYALSVFVMILGFAFLVTNCGG